MFWYEELVNRTAMEHSITDTNLVLAIIEVESSGRADAFRFEPEFWDRYLKTNPLYRGMEPRRVSSSYGLMQVMYPVAFEHGFRGEPEELFIPRMSVFYGCKHFASLLDWADDEVDSALAAYNGGRGGNSPRDGKPDRNREYAAKVRRQYGIINAAEQANKTRKA